MGNFYVNNLFLLKTKICLGAKPKINFNYRINLEDKYDSKINIKTRNLNSMAFNYKGKITDLIGINFSSKFYFFKKFDNYLEFFYEYSKTFKMKMKTGVDYNFNIHKKIKNYLSIGFEFSGFEFNLPLNLSNYDNMNTLMELFTYNILINILSYFTHFFITKSY